MWRDILLVVGFILATLTFFELTPRKVFRLTKNIVITIGSRIPKESNGGLYQHKKLTKAERTQLIILTTLIIIGILLFNLFLIESLIYSSFSGKELAYFILKIVLLNYVFILLVASVLINRISEIPKALTIPLVFVILTSIPVFIAHQILMEHSLIIKLGIPVLGLIVGFILHQLHLQLKEKPIRYGILSVLTLVLFVFVFSGLHFYAMDEVNITLEKVEENIEFDSLSRIEDSTDSELTTYCFEFTIFNPYYHNVHVTIEEAYLRIDEFILSIVKKGDWDSIISPKESGNYNGTIAFSKNQESVFLEKETIALEILTQINISSQVLWYRNSSNQIYSIKEMISFD